jgi:hypothetical protein
MALNTGAALYRSAMLSRNFFITVSISSSRGMPPGEATQVGVYIGSTKYKPHSMRAAPA